jgi:hypothetical protein
MMDCNPSFTHMDEGIRLQVDMVRVHRLELLLESSG